MLPLSGGWEGHFTSVQRSLIQFEFNYISQGIFHIETVSRNIIYGDPTFTHEHQANGNVDEDLAAAATS